MIFFILGISLVLKIILFIKKRDEPLLSDCQDYHDLALHLLKWEFRVPGTKLDEFRTPGYPFFISLIYRVFGIQQEPVYIVQIIINLATIYIAYLIGSMLSGQITGVLLACILVIDPDTVNYIFDFLTETLFTFFLLLSIYLMLLFDHSGAVVYPILTGIVLSTMTYIKPGAFLLPVIYCCILPWDEMNYLLGAYLIPLVFWFMRNYVKYGHFRLCSISAYNLYAYNTNADEKDNFKESMIVYLIKKNRKDCGFEIMNYLNQKARNVIFSEPFIIIKNIIKGLYRLHFSATWHLFSIRFLEGSSWPEKTLTFSKGNWKYIRRPLLLYQFICLMMLYPLTLLGIVEIWNTKIGLMLTCIILYFGLLPLGAGHPRYKIPIIPLMLLIAINYVI